MRPGGAERVYLDYLRGMKRIRPIPVLVRPHGGLAAEITDGFPIYHLEKGGTRALRRRERSWSDSGQDHDVRDSLLGGGASLLMKARRLTRIARAESASIVSTFLHKSHAVALVAKLALDGNLRVVVNVHEHPTQHLETHFSRSRRRLMRGYYRWLLPRADRIVAVSRGIRDDLVERFNISDALIDVTRNPIDVETLRFKARAEIPSADLPAGAGPLVVGVGRLEWIKGFDLLVEALGAVRRTVPARLALVGDGTARADLEALAASLGLDGCVSFPGYRENPMPYMAAADLLVLPSRTEAWPNVIGEAMAIGTPVLAARCSPGVEEFLGCGRYGTLVEPHDPRSLAEGIADVLSRPERLSELSRLGRERASEFDHTTVIAHYESVLELVMSGRGGVGP